MTIIFILLALMVLLSIMAVCSRNLLHAVIALALVSVALTVVLFMFQAPLAAVFELSVCAGFITVIFISTISLSQPLSNEQIKKMTQTRWKRYIALPLILGVIIPFFYWKIPFLFSQLGAPTTPFFSLDVKRILWELRTNDLVGQLLVIVSGVLAVIILFKESSSEKKVKGD